MQRLPSTLGRLCVCDTPLSKFSCLLMLTAASVLCLCSETTINLPSGASLTAAPERGKPGARALNQLMRAI